MELYLYEEVRKEMPGFAGFYELSYEEKQIFNGRHRAYPEINEPVERILTYREIKIVNKKSRAER